MVFMTQSLRGTEKRRADHQGHEGPAFQSSSRPRSGCDFAAPIGIVVALIPVVFPHERLEIAQGVRATLGYRDNVVDFPTPLTRDTVLIPLHVSAAGILSKSGVSRVKDAFSPDSLNGCIIEPSPLGCCVVIPCHNLAFLHVSGRTPGRQLM
jgi:hypothetical protein